MTGLDGICLEEVMLGKSFPKQWVNWVMQTVKGGEYALISMEQGGPYIFQKHEGFKAGGPLSPLLFNLVAVVLSVKIDKAMERNMIVAVLDSVIERDLSYTIYRWYSADGSDESITNLKFILYCFEWLSGLKINYHKNEVTFFFWFSQAERQRKASILS